MPRKALPALVYLGRELGQRDHIRESCKMSGPKRRWLPRYRLRYLLLGMALFAVALAVFVKRPPSRAAGMLKFAGTPPSIVETKSYDPAEFDRFRKNQRSLITSPLVLNPVLARSEIAMLPLIKDQRDPLEYLSSKLSVSWTGEEELIEVSFSDYTDNPIQLATIVNVVLAEYLSSFSHVLQREITVNIEVLDNEMFLRQTVLERLKSKLLSLQAEGKQTVEQKKQILLTEQELAVEEKLFATIEWQSKVLQTSLRAPARASLSSHAMVVVDGTKIGWWESFLNW